MAELGLIFRFQTPSVVHYQVWRQRVWMWEFQGWNVRRKAEIQAERAPSTSSPNLTN